MNSRVVSYVSAIGAPEGAAASRNGHRTPNGADQIVCSHSHGDALGAFPGRRSRKGTRGVGEANVMIDDLLWWTTALKDGSRALIS